MNDITDDKLMAAAATLPTEIAPERDLWPDIEAAIAHGKVDAAVGAEGEAVEVVAVEAPAHAVAVGD